MARKLTQKEFIEKAKKIHGDRYDYSKANYINGHTKVCIICKKHGEFWQLPLHHLSNHGCPECGGRKKLNKYSFIEKSRNIHGNKYDYSKINYINNKTKICIICPEHGEFWQTPNDHLCGKGCEKCAGRNLSTEDFIKLSKKIHGDKYDYSKVNYVNGRTKVCLICPEHGEFYQMPQDHLDKHGCPFCNESKLENEIENLLVEKNIIYEKQKTFEWLVHKTKMKLDFYLPQYNTAIECQGIQHYEPVKHFGGEKTYLVAVERDKKKNKLCKENGVKLLYFTHYKNINKNADIYCSKKDLLNELKL